MTLASIYNAVCNLVYGDVYASPVPVAEVPFIQSLILAKHRDCQIGWNYYFQKVITTFPLLTGIDTYIWPLDYKEYVSLDLDSNMTLTADGFKLESAPTEDKAADFTYWRLIPAPVWTDVYEDIVTIVLPWYIIYSVTGDVMLMRSSQTEASAYYQLADQAKSKAEQEDYQRRQSPGVII